MGAYSGGLIDVTSTPEVNAEENTSGIPIVEPSNVSSINGRELEMQIFRTVNERREEYGRESFVHSERVRLISRLHSHDMGERDYFNHTSPDGLTPPDRHEKYDGCDTPNENIVRWGRATTNNTTKIAPKVVDSWKNPSGHNMTMMSDYYHVSGVGVYVTQNRTLYVTQNFCREHPNA